MSKSKKNNAAYSIELVSVDSLVINAKNPRKIKDFNFSRLKKSIEDFPEMLSVRPVVFRIEDGNAVVIGGNQRLRAVLELGWTEVPAINVTGWSDEKIKEFMIKDNNSEGDWDREMLIDDWDLDLLKSWGDFDDLNPFESEFDSITNEDAEMPIVPRYNEKYGAVVIVMKNEAEIAMVETLLGLDKAKCYKTDRIQKSYVIGVDQLAENIKR